MSTIEIKSVAKSFGETHVLADVDLSIGAGEFVVLVGPSGCGKSTLLRMIAGLEDVSSGDIMIAGRRVNDLAPKDRNLAMVFQSYALYPHMTVADNMSYSLRIRKVAREAISRAVDKAAETLGLAPLVARKPRTLSGGQRQRVAMGRAIVREPQAFLFDEPLSNLDARLREQMRGEIKKLHYRLGATSIYVTHDQIEAMTLADRIVAMDGGSIQQIGSPAELYDRPSNLFVAGFIGSPAMNFIAGRFQHGSDGPSIDIGEGRTIAIAAPIDVAAGMEVTIGVRPEHVVVGARDGDAASKPVDANGLPHHAMVELIEPTGMGMIVHLRYGDAVLKAFHVGRLNARPDDVLPFALPAEHLHLFLSSNGQRIEQLAAQ